MLKNVLFVYLETLVIKQMPLEKLLKQKNLICYIRIMAVVFNSTFNNISVISWWSVLLVEETGVPRENHRHAVYH
jgi:hypothetical protein